MKAAKRASGWYCQSRPDVHTHIYPPHILAPSTCSVELSLYFRCIGTTLVWPLCLPARPSIDWWPLTSTHCTLPPSSKALCIHYSPFVMHSYTHSLSLFLAFLRMQTHEHILFLPHLPPPPPSFFLDPTVRFGVTVHLHHAAFPQFLHTGGLHFTQESSLCLALLWMLAIIPHKHKIRL